MAPARVLAVISLALLATCVYIVHAEVADSADAGAGRELLQGRGGGYTGNTGDSGRPARSFDTVAQHKQPKRPTPATRKSFERKMPTGRLLLADDAIEASAGRELLQGGGGPRPLDKVAQHKQPQRPVMTRKSFDRKMPTGRLLLEHTDDITDAGAGRELLQGRGGGYTGNTGDSGRPARSFDTVAQHKQPKRPTPATRKSFERKMPTGRKLLTDDAIEASAGRELLQGGGGPRPLDKVAQHKQPQRPVMTRKSFDRKMPAGRLLLEALTDAAGAGRELLQGRGGGYTGNTGDSGRPARSFDTVAQHKQPKRPTPATRKSFERKMPAGL